MLVIPSFILSSTLPIHPSHHLAILPPPLFLFQATRDLRKVPSLVMLAH